ncbi:MAG: proliferating cell nuclear antigen (pcna) [Candidatus Thermoplasmatota archaeon]
MFKATVKPEVLKEVVDVVSTLVDEAKFTVSKKEITVKAVDPAHVAMVDLKLDKEAFEEYKADDTELGMSLDKLKEVLRLTRAGDVITIEHDEEKNRIVFKVGNVTRRMALVDTAGMSDPKVPNLNLPVNVRISTEELRQGIRASETISDHVAFLATSDGFRIVSEGDTDSMDLYLPREMLEELDCKDGVRSLYPLDYFSSMVKAISTAPSVMMLMGNDYPVKIEFTIAHGKGDARYLLAPRIETS